MIATGSGFLQAKGKLWSPAAQSSMSSWGWDTYTYTPTVGNQSSIFRKNFSQRSPYFKRESYRSNCYLLLSIYLQKILTLVQKILKINLNPSTLTSVVSSLQREVRRLFSPWITHEDNKQHSQPNLLELILFFNIKYAIFLHHWYIHHHVGQRLPRRYCYCICNHWMDERD